MSWPDTIASKITALFFHLKFQDSLTDLLNKNILVEEMNFYPLEGSQEIKKEKANLVAGELLKFLDGLNIKMEPDGNLSIAHKDLVQIMIDGKRKSSEVPKVINNHFKFIDEE